MSDTKPEVMLIDLSSIAHMIYHVSASEPDPDYTSKTVVNRIHALAEGNPHVAICCDSGRSFRRDISPDYKANRPERDEILMHQIALIREQLVADGFPVWAAEAFEADDLLGTATLTARSAGHPVLIVTGDKDLLQLVTAAEPPVRCKSVQTGAVLDTEGVVAKLGVLPAQIVDYLALVGDTSDNIKGAPSVGPKTAAALLKEFGTLDDVYAILDSGVTTPTISIKLRGTLSDFRLRLATVRALVTLRTDVPVDTAALFAERAAPPMASDPEPEPMTREAQMDADIVYAMPNSPVPDAPLLPIQAPVQTTAIARVEPVIDAVAVPYERQLDPRNMSDAITMAKDMFAARVFGAGSPQEAMGRILAGRELGLPAITSLRLIKIVEGNLSMPAQLIVGLVMKSGFARYFRCTERTNDAATYETQRGDDPPQSLRFTVEDGRRAWPGTEDKFEKSGWGRNPADMCVARASSKLARLVYPDITANLYSPEEIAEMKGHE